MLSYKDQYNMLMETLAREREELDIRERAQSKVTGLYYDIFGVWCDHWIYDINRLDKLFEKHEHIIGKC